MRIEVRLECAHSSSHTTDMICFRDSSVSGSAASRYSRSNSLRVNDTGRSRVDTSRVSELIRSGPCAICSAGPSGRACGAEWHSPARPAHAGRTAWADRRPGRHSGHDDIEFPVPQAGRDDRHGAAGANPAAHLKAVQIGCSRPSMTRSAARRCDRRATVLGPGHLEPQAPEHRRDADGFGRIAFGNDYPHHGIPQISHARVRHQCHRTYRSTQPEYATTRDQYSCPRPTEMIDHNNGRGVRHNYIDRAVSL